MQDQLSHSARIRARVAVRGRNRTGGDLGQALVELGIVIVLFMLLSLGIVEFGRILMITNVITHAARDGARAAAVAARDAGGAIVNANDIKENVVRDQIKNVMGPAAASFVIGIQLGSTGAGIPTATVQVTGQVPYLYAGFLFSSGGSALTINRAVTFRDERR